MIYRFLRGVEAMGLIDDEQRPTDRLRGLVEKETRRQAIGEVLNDLYPELLAQYRDGGGTMSDRDMVAYFRRETGMGNDSANKMKMFFKYLLTEAEGGEPAPAAEEAGEPPRSKKPGRPTRMGPRPGRAGSPRRRARATDAAVRPALRHPTGGPRAGAETGSVVSEVNGSATGNGR